MILLKILMFTTATVSASSAVLQTHKPTGTHIPQPIPTSPIAKEEAAAVRNRFAACVYKAQSKRVDALLSASDPLSADYAAIGVASARIDRALRMDTCLSRATDVTDTDLVLKTDFASLRKLLAEQSYLAHNPVASSWLAQIPKVTRTFVSKGDDLVRAQIIADFSDCLVAAAPREADAFLRSAATSPAEMKALKRLAPFAGPCLSAGASLELTATDVRGFVAEGLWAARHEASRLSLATAGAR